MKRLGIVLVLCCLLFCPIEASAETEDLFSQQFQSSGLQEALESLEPESQSILEQWGIDSDSLLSGKGLNFQGVWQTVCSIISDVVQNPLVACSAGAGVILLCSLTETFMGTTESGSQMVHYFGGACIGVVMMLPFGELLSKTVSAVTAAGQFMLVFLPVFAGILIRAGRPLTAGGTVSVVFGCSQFILYLAKHLLLPFMGMFLALTLSQSLSGGMKTDGLVSAVKKTLIWVLGLSTTLYLALLTVTGIINGAGDSLAQRTTRFFIGNMVPVIGGTLSESLGTLQACFSALKTGGGVLGVLGVLAVLLPIICEILLWRLGSLLLVVLSDWLGTTDLSRLLQAIGEAVGLLLSVVICCLTALVVSMGVVATVGGG